MYARARLAGNRIAVVDWDVHHGNGHATRILRESRGAHYFDSSGQPLSNRGGGISENGSGRCGINIPMPPGSGAGSYLAAFERVAVPAPYSFKPAAKQRKESERTAFL